MVSSLFFLSLSWIFLEFVMCTYFGMAWRPSDLISLYDLTKHVFSATSSHSIVSHCESALFTSFGESQVAIIFHVDAHVACLSVICWLNRRLQILKRCRKRRNTASLVSKWRTSGRDGS